MRNVTKPAALAVSLLVATLVAAIHGAQAATPTVAHKVCTTTTMWVADATYESSETMSVLAAMDGAAAKAVVDRTNASQARAHVRADHAIVLGIRAIEHSEEARPLLVGLFEHGCLVGVRRADLPEAAAMRVGKSI